jgi:hypothetical protein
MDMKKPVRNNAKKLSAGTTPADADPPRVVCNDDKNIWFILDNYAKIRIQSIPSNY